MENIIKYSRPKNYQGRYNIQATTVSVSSDGGGGDAYINWDEIENYINNNQLWKNSHAATSLVPRNSQNDARGDYSVAIGDNTLTYHRGELAIGHFNKSTNGTTTYFTIGNGTSNSNRSNLFEVNATKTTCYNPFSANTISAQTGNFTNLKTPNLSANTITAEDASITNLSAITSNLSAATIGELEAEEATIDSLSANSFSADTGEIKTLEVSGLTASGITTQYLTVTKSAHFFELIIDKIKAAGGSILLTPADGFRVDRVGNNADGSRTLYFRSNDGERAIKNMWQVNDQAICQSFNQARVGQTQNVRNKYYWSLVTATGTTTIENEEYHYITISGTIKEGTLQCEIGDEIAMLGHRGTDKTRQSAIFISAYSSYIDTGVTAPCIVQYENVNTFNLTAANRKNVISHNLVSFTGDFTTTAGDNVANYLSQLNVSVDGINTRVGTLEQKIDFETQVTVDATSLDPTKCYPVTINFNSSNDPKQIRCAVSRTLIDDYGVPNYSTHTRGFVLDLDWTTRASGWGTNWVERRWYQGDRTRFIQEFEVHYTNNTDKVVGSIGQVTEASIEVVYVRGGSKYDILTSFKNAVITLHASGYTWENEEYAVIDVRPVIDYTDLVVPIKDRMGRSEIKQTADNIQLNVYNELNIKTGIDVSTGQITLDGDKTTITGDLDIKGLTTENVTRVDRTTNLFTLVNLGKLPTGDTDDSHKIKSVQVGGGNDVHFVVLPFYDSNFNNWKNQTDITFNTDGSFYLCEATGGGNPYPEWTRKVQPYTLNGTKLTITNEVQAIYRNWKGIENYSDENKRIYSNQLLGTVIVCSDPRVISKENLNSINKQFNPHNLSGSLEAQPILKGGCFSVGGYYSRFIALAPGQSLQLKSQIVTIGSSTVLMWVVENPTEFVPLLNAEYTFVDWDTAAQMTYYGHNEPVFNPSDSYNAILECVMAPNVMNYQSKEVTNDGKGKYVYENLYG